MLAVPEAADITLLCDSFRFIAGDKNSRGDAKKLVEADFGIAQKLSVKS